MKFDPIPDSSKFQISCVSGHAEKTWFGLLGNTGRKIGNCLRYARPAEAKPEARGQMPEARVQLMETQFVCLSA